MPATSLVWLRSDLRIADNPALAAAIAAGGRVVALHVLETGAGLRHPGAASRWWLHRSLRALERDLAALGIPLVTAEGPAEEVLPAQLRVHGAGLVTWNRRYHPAARAVDATIKARCAADGIAARSFPGDVLVEPFEMATGKGTPYSVFTPFWRALRTRQVAAPLPAPPAAGLAVDAGAADAGYTPPAWSARFEPLWQIGEQAARDALLRFLDGPLAEYPEGRDIPAAAATSRLSPHLAFGEIGPRQLWHAALAAAEQNPVLVPAVEKFLSELAWRDFHYHQLYHRADIAAVPMQPKFADLPWRNAPRELEAWQRGRTGFPLVDAGMRELWATGTMHNRVRMVAASLLVKNLLIDWRLGEQWFWDTLVDADPASNPGNWQWVAGCGLDAAPYFRIFNPVAQGRRFDPDGAYVRRWIPALARLPAAFVHDPASAPPAVLAAAGVRLGSDYPAPIVDLALSRRRALDALAGR